MDKKRHVELVVISDIHLGTFGSRARELIVYLRSIQPETLVLNGDIIDIWQFRKHYFPTEHMQVIKEITFQSGGTVPIPDYFKEFCDKNNVEIKFINEETVYSTLNEY